MELFIDFISPYAYLAAEKVAELDPDAVVTPILLAALLNHNQQRGPAEIPDKRRYMFKHVSRMADEHGLRIQPPPAHPFNPLLPLRLASLRPDLLLPIFRRCWRDGQAIDTPASLLDLCDAATLEEASAAKQTLRQSTERALSLGIFGVPSLLVKGEIFWGFDSFAHIRRFLEGHDPVDPLLVEKWETLPASAHRLKT
ncbi:DsbA family protein [bacterium]|nr:DsbA family protein [bacterium]